MTENRMDWIVSDVIQHLNDAQKIEMLLSPKQQLFLFHHGLGRKSATTTSFGKIKRY